MIVGDVLFTCTVIMTEVQYFIEDLERKMSLKHCDVI